VRAIAVRARRACACLGSSSRTAGSELVSACMRAMQVLQSQAVSHSHYPPSPANQARDVRTSTRMPCTAPGGPAGASQQRWAAAQAEGRGRGGVQGRGCMSPAPGGRRAGGAAPGSGCRAWAACAGRAPARLDLLGRSIARPSWTCPGSPARPQCRRAARCARPGLASAPPRSAGVAPGATRARTCAHGRGARGGAPERPHMHANC